MSDSWHMRAALGLAWRTLGRVAPNPAVGCVLVRSGEIVGRGWTAPGGRPHAETMALQQAGTQAEGATAYITLEPCAHQGETPPCAEALIAAGIARAVIAADDPDPRVNGQGIARLEAAGIAVTTGVMADAARRVNAGFFKRVSEGRPLFTLKTATSLDGRIAAASGESQWITGDNARARGHLLRAQHDAVLVGAGTAAADDPALTCRLPGLEDASPVRIVIAGDRGLSPDLTIFRNGNAPTWLIVPADRPAEIYADIESAGIPVLTVPRGESGVDLSVLARLLGERGLTRVLIEGGGWLAASFLAAGLADRLVWFRAPSLIGGDGLAAVAALGVQALESAPRFELVSSLSVGADVMDCFEART